MNEGQGGSPFEIAKSEKKNRDKPDEAEEQMDPPATLSNIEEAPITNLKQQILDK